MKRRTWVWWSTGKDSAWTLHWLRLDPLVEVTGIVTTVTPTFDRVSVHGVRREILLKQAERLGLPLHEVPIPYPCSNEEYERAVESLIEGARAVDVTAMAFGDLYLGDVRAYREDLLRGTGIEPLFPLWLEDTTDLARTMLSEGLEAWITCVDPRVVDETFAGRRLTADLLEELPEGVDPCGENGEFHTCVVDGPFFSGRIRVTPGEVVHRDGFVFADLELDDAGIAAGACSS